MQVEDTPPEMHGKWRLLCGLQGWIRVETAWTKKCRVIASRTLPACGLKLFISRKMNAFRQFDKPVNKYVNLARQGMNSGELGTEKREGVAC